MKKLKLAILFGGTSKEHIVSLKSASSILANINSQKYEIYPILITESGDFFHCENSLEINDKSRKVTLSVNKSDKCFYYIDDFSKLEIDCIFPVMHGTEAEDGKLQGLFEVAGINYVGCGVATSANSMDKSLTKIIVGSTGIRQAKFFITTDICENKLTYPVFIKPCSNGSSVGVMKAKDDIEFKLALENAFKYDNKVLVEEFVDGREIELAILGNDELICSQPGEIIAGDEFYSFDAKYVNNTSKCHIPAELSQEVIEKLRENAMKIYKTLACSGLSRVDFFVRQDNEIIFNEINTMPGFTDISMYPKLMEHIGVNYSTLIDDLITLAMEKDNG